MERDTPLVGLTINGWPFFARTRQLELSQTSCANVLELSWYYAAPTVDMHLAWLLRQLGHLDALERPFLWTSRHRLTDMPVRFEAGVVSPIGYKEAWEDHDARFYLCFLVTTEEGVQQPCPSGCNHHTFKPWYLYEDHIRARHGQY